MHFSIQNIIFLLVALAGFGLFAWQASRIRANVLVGRDRDMSGHVNERLWKTLLVAFGQQKMFKRLTPAFLHLIVYVGFIVINIEVIEIMVDGLFGTHRFLQFAGPLYSALTGSNEILGALVVLAVVAFWWRRNANVVKRFTGPEMRAWPKMDANIILYVEVVLMVALFLMNTADLKAHQLQNLTMPGAYPISQFLTGLQIQPDMNRDLRQTPQPGLMRVGAGIDASELHGLVVGFLVAGRYRHYANPEYQQR